MKTERSGLDQYLDEVAEHLPGSILEKEKLLKEIREFLVETPGIENMPYEDILKILDSPKEFAAEYVSDESGNRVINEITRKRRFRKLIIILIVVFMGTVLGLLLFDIIDKSSFRHGYVEYTGPIEGQYVPPTGEGIRNYH